MCCMCMAQVLVVRVIKSFPSMSHERPLLIPRFTSLTLSTCTSSCASPAPLTSLSDSNATIPDNEARYGRLAKSEPLTDLEPNELSDAETTPSLFHNSSVASTYDPSENTAALLLDPEMDDERIRDMRASPMKLRRERSKRRPATSLSLSRRKLCVTLSAHSSEYEETRCFVRTQEKIESRVAHRQR